MLNLSGNSGKSSSRVEIIFLKIKQNSQEKNPCWSAFFNNVSCWSAATLFKRASNTGGFL